MSITKIPLFYADMESLKRFKKIWDYSSLEDREAYIQAARDTVKEPETRVITKKKD